jgi:hypothetical protein
MTAPHDTDTSDSPDARLQQHRRHIDRIDKTIVALVSERVRIDRMLNDLLAEAGAGGPGGE